MDVFLTNISKGLNLKYFFLKIRSSLFLKIKYPIGWHGEQSIRLLREYTIIIILLLLSTTTSYRIPTVYHVLCYVNYIRYVIYSSGDLS